MMYPLILGLAADKIPVAVTCREVALSKQAFYAWCTEPVSQPDWDDAHRINARVDIHHDHPEFGYRFIADELAANGITASRNRHRQANPSGHFSGVRRRHRARRPAGAGAEAAEKTLVT